MTGKVNLHALANAPGATLWVVNFTGEARIGGWVEVRAVDEKTAREVADGKIRIADCDIDELLSWRITSVEACPERD